MEDRDVRRAAGLVAGAPPAAMLLVRLFAAEGAVGLFQTDLAALVVAAGVSAFAMRARLLSFAAILLAAVLCALSHALLGGSLGGAPAVGWLVLASGVGASGLAAIGRGLGAWGERLTQPGDVTEAVRAALVQDRPAVVDCVIDPSKNLRQAI